MNDESKERKGVLGRCGVAQVLEAMMLPVMTLDGEALAVGLRLTTMSREDVEGPDATHAGLSRGERTPMTT